MKTDSYYCYYLLWLDKMSAPIPAQDAEFDIAPPPAPVSPGNNLVAPLPVPPAPAQRLVAPAPPAPVQRLVAPPLPGRTAGTIPVPTGFLAPPAPPPKLPSLRAENILEGKALQKQLPGITITGVTGRTLGLQANLNELFAQEDDESFEDFETRMELTQKLASIPGLQLNNITAVTAGFLIMKQSKLGVTYTPDVQSVLVHLLGLL
jgi:hypothetical protein